MAETLTVDTTPQTETMPDNLTPEEQDSLAVGEKLQAEQEGLLAGKYKSAEELEKAYVELQKKLGESKEEDTEQSSAEPEPEDKPQLSEGATLIQMLAKNTLIMVINYHQRLLLSSLLYLAKILSKPTWRCNLILSFNSRQHHQLRLLHHRSIRSRTQQAVRKPMLI